MAEAGDAGRTDVIWTIPAARSMIILEGSGFIPVRSLGLPIGGGLNFRTMRDGDENFRKLNYLRRGRNFGSGGFL